MFIVVSDVIVLIAVIVVNVDNVVILINVALLGIAVVLTVTFCSHFTYDDQC